MEVYLVRHTETLAAKGICYGQSDVGIVEPSKRQISEIVNLLPSVPVVIFSSPLLRCVTLAKLLSTYIVTCSDIKFDNRLVELNFGKWELMAWDDISMVELQPWMDDFVNVTVPDGESFTDLLLRVGQFVKSLSEINGGYPILIITHAGVIRSFYAHLKEYHLSSVFEIDVPYGSVHRFVI